MLNEFDKLQVNGPAVAGPALASLRSPPGPPELWLLSGEFHTDLCPHRDPCLGGTRGIFDPHALTQRYEALLSYFIHPVRRLLEETRTSRDAEPELCDSTESHVPVRVRPGS